METRDGNQMLRRKFPLAMETTIESKNGRGVKPKVGRSRPQKEGKGRKGEGQRSSFYCNSFQQFCVDLV